MNKLVIINICKSLNAVDVVCWAKTCKIYSQLLKPLLNAHSKIHKNITLASNEIYMIREIKQIYNPLKYIKYFIKHNHDDLAIYCLDTFNFLNCASIYKIIYKINNINLIKKIYNPKHAYVAVNNCNYNIIRALEIKTPCTCAETLEDLKYAIEDGITNIALYLNDTNPQILKFIKENRDKINCIYTDNIEIEHLKTVKKYIEDSEFIRIIEMIFKSVKKDDISYYEQVRQICDNSCNFTTYSFYEAVFSGRFELADYIIKSNPELKNKIELQLGKNAIYIPIYLHSRGWDLHILCKGLHTMFSDFPLQLWNYINSNKQGTCDHCKDTLKIESRYEYTEYFSYIDIKDYDYETCHYEYLIDRANIDSIIKIVKNDIRVIPENLYLKICKKIKQSNFKVENFKVENLNIYDVKFNNAMYIVKQIFC